MSKLEQILDGASIRQTLLESTAEFKLKDTLWEEICRKLSWDKYNKKYGFTYDILMRDKEGQIFPYVEEPGALDTLVEVEFQNITVTNSDVPVGGWEIVREKLEDTTIEVKNQVWQIYSAEGNVTSFKDILLPNKNADLFIPNEEQTSKYQNNWLNHYCRSNGWTGLFPKGPAKTWTDGQREEVENFLDSIGTSLATLTKKEYLVVSEGTAEIKLKLL